MVPFVVGSSPTIRPSFLLSIAGVSPSGKASVFDTDMQRFESFYSKMSHILGLNFVTYSTILISVLLALIISAVVLALSYLLAIQTPDSEKTSAYECGFEPFEDARNRFDVRFYIVAILFIIFDLEVAFLFPWGITLGWTGFVGYGLAIFFLLLLTIGFIYEVVKGALNPQ